MPTIQCSITGFEDVSVTFPYPDKDNSGVWKVRHNREFWSAYSYDHDPTKVLNQVGLFYGCLKVAKVEGLPESYSTDDPDEFPLELFLWIIKTVYEDNFAKTVIPSKN